MTYVLSFLPEVEEDAIGGYRWYEEKGTGLGEGFLRIFYACAQGLQAHTAETIAVRNLLQDRR